MTDYDKNEYAEIPISEGIVGMDEDSIIRGTTELYIPRKFGRLNCKVEAISHCFQNMKKVVLTVDFVVNGDISFQNTYYNDKEFWKAHTLKNFFEKTRPFKRDLKYPLPIIGLMLNKYLSVEKVIDKLKDEEVPFDQSIDTVFSSSSVKPKQQLADDEYYKYYNKKTTFIYDNLELGKKYSYEITLISEGGSFEFGLLSPYGVTEINDPEAYSNSEIGTETFLSKVEPIVSKDLPPLLLEKLRRYLPESYKDRSYPTHMRPASNNRGEETLFPPDGSYGTPIMKKDEKNIPINHFFKAGEGKVWKLNDFEAIRFCNTVMIPPNKELDIIVAVQEGSIPSRIYEQIQSMNKYYEDVLINFDIFNLSHTKMRLRVEAEIDGYTSVAKKTIFLHCLGGNRRVREKVSLCPRMKRDILKTVVNPERATLIAKVINEDTKEVVFDETFPVTILPADEMVWSLKSIKNSKTFNLSKFISAWIYPKDLEGSFDAVRAGAVKYHPEGLFFYDGTYKSLMDHVKAIYEYLSNDIKMVYVNQPFNSSKQFDGQRVVLPEQSLKNKVGNCIDLTVLMASLLEGFGINSLVFITPDHAFIGWGNPKTLRGMIALEMTAIGRYSFEEALETGYEQVKKNYVLQGASDIMILSLMSHVHGCHIISLEECRAQGIVSQNDLV